MHFMLLRFVEYLRGGGHKQLKEIIDMVFYFLTVNSISSESFPIIKKGETELACLYYIKRKTMYVFNMVLLLILYALFWF